MLAVALAQIRDPALVATQQISHSVDRTLSGRPRWLIDKALDSEPDYFRTLAAEDTRMCIQPG
jgi:hypothetical protein